MSDRSGDALALARIAALGERARRLETTGPGGGMIWHAWGEGPPLVLLHGGSGSWTHWVENIEPLAAGHRVLAGDLPGLGDSPSPAEPYDAASLARIVAAGIHRILDGTAFDLAGFSFGGIVGGHVAAAPGANVRSLAIIGSPVLGLPSGAGPANAVLPVDAALDLDAARELHRRNLATLMLADPRRVDALAIRIHHDNLRRARLRSRRIARTLTLAEALDRVECPVHGIWGERDVTVHPDMDALRARILAAGAGSTFDVMPGLGHWVMYEAPQSFDRLLLSRLAAHAAG